MKKKILLFLAVFVLSACIFTLAVGASSIYSDYTQKGVNGEAPIFSCLGFAINESSGSMCVEYTVDLDALEAYEEKIGGRLNYGLVVANAATITDGKPLDASGNPVADNVIVISLNSADRTSFITVIVTGLNESNFGSEIILSLFVQESNKVQYVGEDETTETTVSTSYDKVLNGDEPEVEGPIEVTVNGMKYSTDAVTEPAWDRIKQQNASNADYNTGSHYTEKELVGSGLFSSSVKSKANLIVTGGSLLGYSHAAKFMKHFLNNTGTDYNLDVKEFLSSDSGAMKSRNDAITNALRAAELIAKEGKTYTINQLTENHPMQNTLTEDWQYSLGSYFTDVDIINVTVTEVNGVKTYTADIKYIVTDFYNWDTNNYNKFASIVSPHDLHELHKGGKAKEFMTYGELTYKNVTWTEGQSASAIAGLN